MHNGFDFELREILALGIYVTSYESNWKKSREAGIRWGPKYETFMKNELKLLPFTHCPMREFRGQVGGYIEVRPSRNIFICVLFDLSHKDNTVFKIAKNNFNRPFTY
ncbi:uncharacterized protein [Venturia canescens]|uniref:uncharacterized protein isoform X2 n=1 Tax=Venturia canescens TaxID=32260 RepID=UPI001C9BDFF9|nr:uncharacterized protein LOC122417988 isoform X2 [Venturia canescens]